MKNIRGVGLAKAVQLAAAFKLADRMAKENSCARRSIRPSWLTNFSAEMRALQKESLRVILLDTRYRLIDAQEISLGSVNESIAHPREVFRPALLASAYAIIVVHNHPSGDPIRAAPITV